MKSRVNVSLSMFFLLTLLLSSVKPSLAWKGNTDFPAAHALFSSQEAESKWLRVSPKGEEFSILTPVAPTLLKGGRDYFRSGSSERILEERAYGGYASEFIFYIESYRASRPKSLLKSLDDKRYPLRVMESEIKIQGHDAKQYRLTHEHYYGKYFEVITKKHVYLMTLASRGAGNTSVERFISSLILGDNITEPATGQVMDVSDSPLYHSAVSTIASPPATVQPPIKAYKPSEAGRKAVIVSRPEPNYTDEARRKQVMGTVILRGVFGADGQVRDLKVKQSLEGGLTEKAIAAALSLRFFPAEKDGQLVSQYIQIEYNFNLY
jgi:TonB family protein